MSRRRRGQSKGVANPERVKFKSPDPLSSPSGSQRSVPQPPPRDWDSDGPSENPAHDEAVAVVLEALEGLWYESEYFHETAAEKYQWEQAVNDHVQRMKREIQEIL